jgi:hypothetical protein
VNHWREKVFECGSDNANKKLMYEENLEAAMDDLQGIKDRLAYQEGKEFNEEE